MMNSYLRAAVAVCILLLSLPVLAVPSGPVIGKVALVLGSVVGTDQDGDTFEVVRGTELHAGYSFETGSRSFVRAEMNDGTRMTISQNSTATLDQFSFNQSRSTGTFNATVKKGSFRYISGLLGAAGSSRVHSRISTPSGVIGVRGTTIVAIVNPDGSMTITIPAGTVDVVLTQSDGTKVTQTIGVGQSSQTIQVTSDGQSTGLDQLPTSLQTVVNELVDLVNEAENPSGTNNSGTNDQGSTDPDETDPQPQTYTLDTDSTAETNTFTKSGGGAGDVVDIPASPATRQ
ncbi:MAG: hypothetical protein HOC70_04935 [Gammaproteobacteria bacterium]|jgi:hypothetical protein|nr:hypothetical protein [Gammaproteobacteria bacterium]